MMPRRLRLMIARGHGVVHDDVDRPRRRIDDGDRGVAVLQHRPALRPDQAPLQRRIAQTERLTVDVEQRAGDGPIGSGHQLGGIVVGDWH